MKNMGNEEQQSEQENLNTEEMKENRKWMKRGRRNQLIASIFVLGFVLCIVWLIKYLYQTYKAEEDMEALKATYVQAMPISTTEETQESVTTPSVEQPATEEAAERVYPGLDGYDVPEKIIDFEALQQEENEHIYAWITVPGTVIDYPIVQHPEDPDYYLNYNLDGTKGYPGGIYTQFYNSKDWEDANTVIYGHNMKNGTMFAGLHRYEDSEFFEENPYVYIYSEDKVRVYQIFAAYEYADINLVTYFSLPGVMTYEEYLAGIYDIDGMNNNFNTDIQVTTEDKIVTLATCISSKPNMRYLVQAVLVAEGELSAN